MHASGSKAIPVHLSAKKRKRKLTLFFLDLKAKHSDQYDNPKLRLWARMITGGLHDSYDVPPAVPVFQGGPESKRKRETLAGALTGAVETIAKYVEKRTPEVPSAGSSQVNELCKWEYLQESQLI